MVQILVVGLNESEEVLLQDLDLLLLDELLLTHDSFIDHLVALDFVSAANCRNF